MSNVRTLPPMTGRPVDAPAGVVFAEYFVDGSEWPGRCRWCDLIEARPASINVGHREGTETCCYGCVVVAVDAAIDEGSPLEDITVEYPVMVADVAAASYARMQAVMAARGIGGRRAAMVGAVAA